MNVKAQIATETIIAVSILLLFLASIMVYSFTQKSFLDELTETANKTNECTKIALITSKVYSSGKNAYYTLENDYNIYFGSDFIALNDANKEAFKGIYCNHTASLNQEKNFNEGKLIIKNTDWKVAIENA